MSWFKAVPIALLSVMLSACGGGGGGRGTHSEPASASPAPTPDDAASTAPVEPVAESEPTSNDAAESWGEDSDEA